MMVKVKAILEEEMAAEVVIDWRMSNVPRVGDMVRLSKGYAKVIEVMWLIDESPEGESVVIRLRFASN
jgi:hypothetical protein